LKQVSYFIFNFSENLVGTFLFCFFFFAHKKLLLNWPSDERNSSRKKKMCSLTYVNAYRFMFSIKRNLVLWSVLFFFIFAFALIQQQHRKPMPIVISIRNHISSSLMHRHVQKQPNSAGITKNYKGSKLQRHNHTPTQP